MVASFLRHLAPLLLGMVPVLAVPCAAQTTAPEWFQSALKKANAGKNDGALEDYTRSIELDPLHASTYNNRGVIRYEKEDLEGALADYARAMELDPNYALPCYNRAVLRSSQGNLDGALADANEALKRDPKYIKAYHNRAIYLHRKGDSDAAIRDEDSAIKLSPNFREAINFRATLYFFERRWKEAIADLRMYLKFDPDEADLVHIWIYFGRMHLGETSEAYQELSAHLADTKSPDMETWSGKAVLYVLGGMTHDELLKATATEDKEHVCDAWYLLGMKRLQAGDKLGAMAAFKKCLATGMTKRHSYDFARSELKTLE